MRIKQIRMAGIEAEDKRLAALGKAVVTTIANEAIQASANLVAGEWIRVAPYDPKTKLKTRTLKSGERVSTDYGHGRDQISVRPIKPQKKNAVVYKLSTGDAFWLYIYEYGKFDQPPRPVFRAATDRKREQAVRLQTEIFERRVQEEWAKGSSVKGR